MSPVTSTKPQLPHLRNSLYLTDGGAETCMIFLKGYELPCFALFPLLESTKGRNDLRSYYRQYLQTASELGTGFVLEAPTWRANRDWGHQLNYDDSQLDRFNREAIALMQELKEEFMDRVDPVVISGCIGPRGDGYQIDKCMTAEQAYQYHLPQAKSFALAGAELVTGMTIGYANEAIGIIRAADEQGIPPVISFTTETDGCLPDGTALKEVIQYVDNSTGQAAAYYMINCAHPSHFSSALAEGEPWVNRIGGIRANASRLSHAELDEAEELDSGNPEELAREYKSLTDRFPQFRVLGGCCGTDHRHVNEIAIACARP